MTALELLTVLCAVMCLGATAVLTVLSVRLHLVTRALAEATLRFESEAVPAARDLRLAADRATAQVDRVEDLVAIAGSIGERVDAATEVTYRALTSPVVKGVAFASGTRRAAQRLRGKDAPMTSGVDGSR